MKISRFLAAFLIASSLATLAQDAPSGLLCNLLTQPETCVITEPQPDFGWIVPSSQAEDLQTAYQISVASSVELLDKAPADMWGSGKIASAQSINVLYGGKPLRGWFSLVSKMPCSALLMSACLAGTTGVSAEVSPCLSADANVQEDATIYISTATALCQGGYRFFTARKYPRASWRLRIDEFPGASHLL